MVLALTHVQTDFTHGDSSWFVVGECRGRFRYLLGLRSSMEEQNKLRSREHPGKTETIIITPLRRIDPEANGKARTIG